jgi:hypothetical protein
MKSFRQWLTMLALGTALIFSTSSAKAQPWGNSGVPGGFTYQGIFELNGTPVKDANADITITISDRAGSPIWTNTYNNVLLADGIFNMVIGGPLPFTSGMDFNSQYSLTVVVTSTSTGGVPVTLPATQLWSAPYAINAGSVNGIAASETPIAGDLFPVPLGSGYTGSAKIDPAFLPSGVGGSLKTAKDTSISGNPTLFVQGGIAANNPTGATDGIGLSAGSPQTYWADEISVPAATGTSLQIYNTLVSSTSTIILTPFALSATGVGVIAITSQGAGTFTITSSIPMGTGNSGVVTGLNYMVVNH